MVLSRSLFVALSLFVSLSLSWYATLQVLGPDVALVQDIITRVTVSSLVWQTVGVGASCRHSTGHHYMEPQMTPESKDTHSRLNGTALSIV